MKNTSICSGGWIAMYLFAAILQKNELKLIEYTEALGLNYTQIEINKIWRRIKTLLDKTDIEWTSNVLSNNL